MAIVIWLGASPAQAAFPGRNGLLAVEPSFGDGVVLVQPGGAIAGRICDQTALCGIPVKPRWSPDGRYLVFLDAPALRIGVVAADGTCMWCMLGRPLTTLRASGAAFTPDGQSVTLAGRGPGTPAALWRYGLTTATSASVLPGPLADAVWSSTGELAIVRHGVVWVRTAARMQHPRRLGAGTSPSWSPDGSMLAISRGGWLWVIRLRDGRTRRLTPGTAPAWSPDGRLIAYVGRGEVLRIVSGTGGSSRSLGLHALSVDWQPLPRHNLGTCTPPKGSMVTASSAEAVVSSRRVLQNDYYATGWYGCLRGLGKERLLLLSTTDGGESETYVSATPVAGRFALVSSSEGDKYGGCGENLALYDLASGASTPLFSANCEYAAGVQTIGPTALDSSGFSTWRAGHSIPLFQSVNAVSCVSVSLCVAVDQAGSVASSSDPVGGRSAWSMASVAGISPLTSVSCPTTDLCVAASLYRGDILTSTDPTGGPSAWTTTQADTTNFPFVTGNYVSCPSASLCVLGDNAGNVVTSTNPAGGASTWSLAHVDSNTPPGFVGMACPSTSLCVGTSNSGDVITSTNPTGGASAWTISHIDSSSNFPGLSGAACASESLCVSVDSAGNVFTSTDPTGGASAWSQAHLGNLAMSAVSCPSASLCVAVDHSGDVVTSTNPTGGASAWQVANVDGSNPLTAVSCPSATRCVATDRKGNVLTSDDPTGGATAWSSAPVDAPDCAVEKTPCVVEQIYARDDHGARVIDSTPPGAGKSLANISLSANGLVLSWTHDGVAEQATLR